MTDKTDVLIVGAGPTGLTLAVEPARRGIAHRVVERAAASDEVPYPMVRMHPQWRTEAVLRERLAELGGEVEHGVGLTGLEQDAEGVTARLGTGATLRTAYLVAADGGRSTVRKALGVGFTGETREEERMALGDVRVEGLDREHIHAWVRPGRGMVALYPMAGTDCFQFMAPLRPGATPDLTLV